MKTKRGSSVAYRPMTRAEIRQELKAEGRAEGAPAHETGFVEQLMRLRQLDAWLELNGEFGGEIAFVMRDKSLVPARKQELLKDVREGRFKKVERAAVKPGGKKQGRPRP